MTGLALVVGLWAALIWVSAWRWNRRQPKVHRDLNENGRRRVGL